MCPICLLNSNAYIQEEEDDAFYISYRLLLTLVRIGVKLVFCLGLYL